MDSGRLDSKKYVSIREAYSSIYEGHGEKDDDDDEKKYSTSGKSDEKEKNGKKEEDCIDKKDKGAHNCAKKVCHEEFGEGTCIFGEHAEPDRYGFVSHYDVLFEHGVERGVPVSEMEVLFSESHMKEGHRYEGEELTEEMIIEEEMYGYVYDILEVYLMSEGATEEEVAYIVENMSQELIDEGILGAALKLGAKLLKGGKLLKGTKNAKGAISAIKAGKNAKPVPSLGRLGSGNVTTQGAASAPKPGSRAAQLKSRYNVGPEGSDTSAKRQIIDKARQNVASEKQQQAVRNSGSNKPVQDREAQLDRYLKAGYSKYGADRPPVGRGNAANRRATQTNKPAGLSADEESRMRDLRKAIDKFGTPGYPGTNDPSIRRYQKEYIALQRKQAGK